MIYALAIVGAILIFALLTKWWHDAYWRGMTWNIEIPDLETIEQADSYVEFVREVTSELEQNDELWDKSSMVLSGMFAKWEKKSK